MRSLIIGALSAATISIAGPASAQVHVHAPGVGVHVGSGNYYHRDRGYHRGWRANARGDCRRVTKRTVRPNGTVVVRRTTRCR
jgi:hypothetical protein